MNSRPVRVAILADYPEEGWPSMDIIAQMIYSHLQSGHREEIEAVWVCPPYKHQMEILPIKKATLRNADRILNRFVHYPNYLRKLLQRESFDLFHITDHSYSQLVHALPAGRTVVTCHDLDTFRCLLRPDLEPRPTWFRVLIRHTLNGLRKATAISCGSEATENEVLKNGIMPRDRVRTIHSGTHPEFLFSPEFKHHEAANQLAGQRGTQDSPLLLHVGSNIPRKRIDVLLETFAGVRKVIPGARLVKIGGDLTPEQNKQARDLELLDSIRVIPFLGDRYILSAIYRRSSLVLQPSEAEGFGLPLAEAMACGAALLVSDLAVHREVAGNAALYCPVGDSPGWIKAALSVLQNHSDRETCLNVRRSVGFERSSLYRWDHHAAQLSSLYQEINRKNVANEPGMPVA